ncbi:MAG: ABC transporter permease [Actinomycetota bacterium]|nr:ABC transporter permease [Actinomycetota bacterium]
MSPRVLLVTIFALAGTLLAVLTGGVPLVLILFLLIVLGSIALPEDPRRYLLRRVLRVVITVFVAMAFVWMLVHNLPDASRQDETGVVAAMQRYVEWIAALISGDLGDSSYSETVLAGIRRTIPPSAQLMLYSQVITLAIAIPGAMIGARLRGKWGDISFRALGLFGLSTPVFVIGPILVFTFSIGELNLFGRSVGWSILPAGRYVPLGTGLRPHLASMALPTVTMATTTIAIYLVLLRSEMLQQLKPDHVLLARSKGLSPRRIVRAHALRPAAPSVVAAIAAQSGALLSSTVIVEHLFTIPGFGDYVLVAIGRRDVVAVAGALFVIAAILAVVNLFADALLLVIDPRIT